MIKKTHKLTIFLFCLIAINITNSDSLIDTINSDHKSTSKIFSRLTNTLLEMNTEGKSYLVSIGDDAIIPLKIIEESDTEENTQEIWLDYPFYDDGKKYKIIISKINTNFNTDSVNRLFDIAFHTSGKTNKELKEAKKLELYLTSRVVANKRLKILNGKKPRNADIKSAFSHIYFAGLLATTETAYTITDDILETTHFLNSTIDKYPSKIIKLFRSKIFLKQGIKSAKESEYIRFIKVWQKLKEEISNNCSIKTSKRLSSFSKIFNEIDSEKSKRLLDGMRITKKIIGDANSNCIGKIARNPEKNNTNIIELKNITLNQINYLENKKNRHKQARKDLSFFHKYVKQLK